MLRKRGGSQAGGQVGFASPQSFFEGKLPILGAHLSDPVYEDGSARQTSTLLLFTEQGLWKGCLCSRDTDEVAFLTAGTAWELLQKFEDCLEADEMDWRRRSGSKGPRK